MYKIYIQFGRTILSNIIYNPNPSFNAKQYKYRCNDDSNLQYSVNFNTAKFLTITANNLSINYKIFYGKFYINNDNNYQSFHEILQTDNFFCTISDLNFSHYFKNIEIKFNNNCIYNLKTHVIQTLK